MDALDASSLAIYLSQELERPRATTSATRPTNDPLALPAPPSVPAVSLPVLSLPKGRTEFDEGAIIGVHPLIPSVSDAPRTLLRTLADA